MVRGDFAGEIAIVSNDLCDLLDKVSCSVKYFEVVTVLRAEVYSWDSWID